MGSMKLYCFHVAPNPTRVRLYLAEKRLQAKEDGMDPETLGLDVEEVLVDLRAGEQKSDAHRKRNPLAKLPVLEPEPGVFLTESTAIVEYFEELAPKPALFGETPLERARARELDRIADIGCLISIARWVHAHDSPLGLPPNPGLEKASWEQMQAPLALMDAKLGETPYLRGERPGVADCTLAAGLQFGRMGGLGIEKTLPNVAAFTERLKARPSSAGILIL